MKHRSSYIICFLVLAAAIFHSGCIAKSPEESVQSTVMDFLTAVNEDDPGLAFSLYTGKDFLAPASITMIFKNKGIGPGSITEVNIVSHEIVDNLAIVNVECPIATLDLSGNVKATTVVPIYFRLQDSELGWIITRVSFNSELSFENAELVNIEVESTSIDVIVDNAPIISVFAFVMLGTGFYLDKKDKAKKKNNNRTIDVSGAVPLQKEAIAQYIRFVPAQQITAGKVTGVDVWVKNFTQQPYNNFAVKAKFANSLEVENINLFFDNIAPGETVKRTWVLTPKLTGWASIEEPTVIFEYGVSKYIGVLDPVWLQVQ
ncbi:hypothetical protein [Methanolobus psychrotolerans]|uniref:hypothetical protein n=1 Tax=Methanolobus psychrotolerans TaxID=1874706 RepID=UPI000B91603D|nr:hypothetical protein [Methanolobus psychrotolerans]